MKERRSLVDGLKTDPELKHIEEAFVFGTRLKPELVESASTIESSQAVEPTVESPPEHPEAKIENRILPQMTGRIPVTTRCRPEIASALKRASLQRQLAGVEPYYVQDIMEVALETWLREKGYVE
jgi:hypothetical protein